MDFEKATIKMEGGIADPDSYVWECNCADCVEKYQNWKKAFAIQQMQLRGEGNEPTTQT